ncbi:unnamed protein product [Ascophyllum nodosum]
MTLRVCDADRQPQMPTVLGSTCHQQAPPSELSTCSPPAHRHRRSKGCLVITVLFLLEQRMVSSFPRSHRSALPSLIVGGFVGGSCSTGFVMMPAVRKTTKSMRQLELRNWRNSVRARPEASMALDTEMQIETGELLSSRLGKARERLLQATGEYALPHGAQLDEVTGVRKQTRVREMQFKVAEPETRYDPVLLAKQLFKQPVRWLVRNVQLFLPLGTFAATVLLDIKTGVEERNRKKRASELLRIIGGLGPAIIKAGQALSSRPDLLPKEYLDELQKLQDRVPAFSNKEAFAVVEEELGVPFEDVYELVEPEPIAAASIGQVYKARLRVNGNLVAIKVQRPRCEATISLDLYVLRFYAGFFTKALKALKRDVDLTQIIDDFGELIYREIDYRAEMVNCQRFAELYANIPDVFVPNVYAELTSRSVMTMEWVEGARLTDRRALDAYGLEPSKLVDTMVQCSLRQMLENGFFHADPHAGNLLALPNGKLCYLDFGMVSYVEAGQRYGIIEAVIHLVNRDYVALADLYKRLGFIPEKQDTGPIVAALTKALPDVLNASVGELNFKNVVNKLGDVMYTYPFSLPPYYIAIIRCLGVLEGVAIQVDRESRILSEAYPYIASRLLTDSAPELQDALQQLLFKDGKPRWERFEELLEEAQSTRDYDVTLAINQMADFLLSDSGTDIRNQLSVQLVDQVDQLGVDAVTFARNNIGQINAGKIPGILSGDRQILDELMRNADVTPAMSSTIRVLNLLTNSAGFDAGKIIPLLRRLLREPEAQELTIQLATNLSERAISRTIRTIFNVKQLGYEPAISPAPTPTATATVPARR